MSTTGLFSGPAHRPVERSGVPKGKGAAVSRNQPIALAVGGGNDVGDRLIQVERRRIAVALRVPVDGDITVCPRDPVATAIGGGRPFHSEWCW